MSMTLNKMDNMDEIRELLDSVFYMSQQKMRDILLMGMDKEKPNFTQLQMALQGLRSPPEHFGVLLRIMEIRFKLERI